MSKFEKCFVNSDLCNFFHERFIFPKFFRFINNELKGNVLEIGCGVGKTTSLIAQKYNKVKIMAVDYDEEQIKIAKKNKIKNVKFLQGDATKLKFKNSSFDYIIETNTFHHIKDYPKAIKEVSKLLKKDGYFYLMDVSRYFFFWPLYLFFPAESYFAKRDLINNLESNGFKIEKSSGNLIFFIIARKIK